MKTRLLKASSIILSLILLSLSSFCQSKVRKGDGSVIIEMTEEQFRQANANFKAKDSVIFALKDSLGRVFKVKDSLMLQLTEKDVRYYGLQFDMDKKLKYEKDLRIAELDIHYKRMTHVNLLWAVICFPLLLVFARL